MFQKWLNLYEIINLNAPLLKFYTIFVMEKVKHLFTDYYKILLFDILTHQIAILKAWISFKCSLLLHIVKNTSQMYWIWKKIVQMSKIKSYH